MSLERIRSGLADAGLGLTGTLPAELYDSLVPPAWRAQRLDPEARGVLLVGNAGRDLWPRFLASPERSLRRDPLDHYTQRALRDAAVGQFPPAPFALYNETRDGAYLPLIKLGERAGFGRPGRVGLLIHPVYGPWVAIRAALYLREPVPFAEPEAYAPCEGCPAPCASACHGNAIDADGLDFVRCLQTKRIEPACRAGCDARRACIIGPEHAYDAEQVAFHTALRLRPPWG